MTVTMSRLLILKAKQMSIGPEFQINILYSP